MHLLLFELNGNSNCHFFSRKIDPQINSNIIGTWIIEDFDSGTELINDKEAIGYQVYISNHDFILGSATFHYLLTESDDLYFFDVGIENGDFSKGILKIQQNKIFICFAHFSHQNRPIEFRAISGNSTLLVLKKY